MAAANRPEILDPALPRPGRLDRQVLVARPDINGREAILKIHSGSVALSTDVDLRRIAGRPPGFVGSEAGGLHQKGRIHGNMGFGLWHDVGGAL